MQIVINIPENIYKFIKQNHAFGNHETILNAINNGTVLTEHGRLIDADALVQSCVYDETITELGYAPTILEPTET